MKTEKEIRNDQARKKAADLREQRRKQEASASDDRLKRAQQAYHRYRQQKQSESQNQVKDRVDQWLEKSKTVSNRYKSRYGSGTSGYRSDSENWLQEMTAQRDELNREALEIGKYLKDNRSAMGEGFYDYVNSLMHDNRGYHSSVVEQAQKERDYYSQWENEDAYNADMKKRQEYEAKRTYDTKAGKREVAQLENALKEYQSLSRWETDEKGRSRLEELKKQYGDEKGIRDLITQKNAYLTEAERIQKGDRLSGVGQLGSEFYDPEIRFVKADAENQDVQYRYINDEDYRREYQQMLGGAYDNLKEAGLEYLTEDEKRTYNYYYAKGGKEQAQEYLSSIREQLNYRRGTEMFETVEDNGLLEMAFGIEAGIDQWQSGMNSLINNREGAYMVPSARQIASGMVREDLGERSKFAQGAYDVITTTANMAPSILTSTVANILAPGSGAVVGSAMMGASAGGSAYQEMINAGYSKDQARAYGILVGGSETVLGSLLGGISKLGGKVSGQVIGKLMNKVDNVIARTAIKIGGNMLSEGLEEGLQEMLTPWFKSVLTGEEYEVASEDVLYASLLGALSAGLLEGPTTIAGAHGVHQQGVELKAAGIAPQRLAKIGQTFSADTVAYQLAGRVNENTDAYTMGRLFNEIDAELTQLNKDSITSSLMGKGMEERHAKKLAEGFAAVVTGTPLTEDQAYALIMNDVLAQTVREAIIDPNSTVNQRSQGFNEVLRTLSKSSMETSPEVNPETTPTVTEAQDAVPESQYEAPADGKIILKSTDETVRIKEVVGIRDGKMSLKLEDGRTVDAEDVSFGSEDEARVYAAVAEMNVHPMVANVLLENYRLEDTDAEVYAKGIQEAYRFGENNYPMSMAAKGPFTSLLTPRQRDVAYQMGQTFGGKKIAKAQAITRTTAVKNLGPGKVHFDGDRTALSERQQVSLTALDRVASALGVQIHIFDSKSDRRYADKNGWFDPDNNSIHIDLHAGEQGKDTILFTASHELTHFVKKWSPAKFKVLSNFLMQEYGKKDVPIDELVQEQIRFAKSKNREISPDKAFEEVIANSMETMLSDGNVIEKLEKLKAQDRSVWEKIRDYIKGLAAKIKKVYEGIQAESEEGKYVAEMKDAIEQIQNLFAEGLSEAGSNYQAAMERGGVEFDAETESVAPVLYSERTWTESEYVKDRQSAIEAIAKAIGISEKKAGDYIDSINSIAKMIAEDRTRLDYFSSPYRSSFVSNVEYGGSFDFSTLCKKRRLLTGTFTAIQKALPNTALTADEILDIRNRMKEKNLEVSCGLCYVEGSRANMGQFAKEFLKLYKQYYPDAWQPNMSDVNTPDGIEWVRINHPECYEQYEYFWNHYGTLKEGDKNLFASQQKPKLYQLHTEYKGEVLTKFKNDDNVEEKNLNGGIRLQSFSDFEIVHLIDCMQIIMDMSRVGLAGQAYTKVPDFAWALGDTGLKINLSLIAKGVDENGKLIFDDVEGMPIDTAVKLRNRYSKNVGTILVAFNDQQLIAAMADERVDFIIPFHRSQWKKSQYTAMGLPAKTKDYTYMQNEKFIKPQYHEYRGRMVKDKTTNYMPNEYWDFSKTGKENAEAYLEMCARNNKRPKFYKLLQNNGDGSYSLKADGSTDGYWKLLIDFKMYDNEGNGSPQMPVKPEFNMDEAIRMLNAYQGGANQFPVAQGIVDEFVAEYKEKHPGVMYSLRKQSVPTREELEKKDPVKVVDISTPQTTGTFAQRRRQILEQAQEVIKKPYLNRDTGVMIFLTPKSYTHMFSNSGALKMNAAEHLPELVENAILTHAEGPEYGSDYTDGVYTFFAAAMSETLVPVKMKVKEYSYEGQRLPANIEAYFQGLPQEYASSYDTVVLQVEEIEKSPSGSARGVNQNDPLPGPEGLSTITVAELLDLVKGDAKKYIPQHEKSFSERTGEGVSGRAALADAFESLAKTDLERKKVQEYREKAAQYDAEEQKLRELRGQIKELSFAKGPRDKKQLLELKTEATRAANRINIYDKQLLRLEASAPLQAVLEREKAKVAKKAEQRRKEAMKEYREEALRKQERIAKRYQESRKQSIENRNRTAARHKVQRIVKELNDYLLKGTKDRHVPENLQKAVAEALNVVNMDTVGAEERIAKLRQELMAAKTPEKVQEISRKIDSVQAMGDRMKDRLQALKNAYAEFIEAEDSDIQNAYDDVVVSKMETVIQTVGDTPLRDMSLTQLEDVYDMYTAVLTVIRNANKAFKAGKSQNISEISGKVMDEVRGKGKNRKLSTAFMEEARKFGWDNLKPVYAFEHIGSQTLAELFSNVRSGEDAWAKDVSEAREFYRDTARKHNAESWDRKKRYEFESTSGMRFSLDLEQIMSLYAYSKREQAADHLRRGGIVFDETTEVTMKTKLGIPVKFNPIEATAYNISDVTLGEIVGSLTAQQKQFVDEMQEYLSKTMGDKGNEVSMEMYGIRLFKEKNYFPLKSAQQFMAKAKEQQKGEVKIKNSGFSKATVKHASNPVVLTPFMNVWSDHVNEMSMYHAFVLPMEDFYRVYNFKTPTSEVAATESVEMLIQNAFGKGATKYIDQLLKDLNGGARTDPTVGIINKSIAAFKKGAVFASASVVIQQPSAVARALAMVDAKYFIGKLDKQKHGQLWGEVKKYAPVAIIKEMGYFDTNMGKSTEEFILGKEYGNITEKAKALVTDGNYRDEILSRLPALADEMSWCTIWQAVKRETIDKHPGMMTRNREEFMKIVGKRFTEVIVKTQVYDSVLSRSALMRSKDTGMKMATAFMAEPTTSMNMMADALMKAKQGNGKAARTTIGAVIASQIMNAMLVSIVYAARDDDEEKSLTEKYISSVVGKVSDSMNPLTYIPFLKDIVSIVQGYDVERSDMSVISDLWNAWNKLDNENLSAWQKVEGFAGSIAQIFGLPLKNIMRDIRALWQVYDGIVNGEKTTAAGIRYAVQGALTGKDVSNQKQLYEAEISGDENHALRVRGRYKDESKATSAMRSEIRDRYESGELDRQTAMDQLVRLGGMNEDDAYWRIEEWDYALNPDNSEDYSKYSKFYNAVRTGENLKKTVQEYIDNGVEQKTLVSQITGYFREEYVGKSKKDRNAIKGYLVNGFVYCGMTREDALEKIAGWDFQAEHGFDYEDRRAAYRDGKVTAAQLEKILVETGGLTETEARQQVKVYDWQNEGIDISSDQIGIIDDFETWCEPAGISRSVYYDAYLFYKDSGESGVKNSKTKECMPYIDSLPLTAEQKNALALCWWAESTVKKYKTW